jgi:hypothetical protein
MLRQPFVPIKTKRVWFNETGAGVVHARLGRGRAFPPSKPSASKLGDYHARCGGLGKGLSTRPMPKGRVVVAPGWI